MSVSFLKGLRLIHWSAEISMGGRPSESSNRGLHRSLAVASYNVPPTHKKKGYPHKWMVCIGKCHLYMDDDWGYLDFRKPLLISGKELDFWFNLRLGPVFHMGVLILLISWGRARFCFWGSQMEKENHCVFFQHRRGVHGLPQDVRLHPLCEDVENTQKTQNKIAPLHETIFL